MTFKNFVGNIIYLINNEIIPVILGLSLIVFLWGVMRYYILRGADANSREQAHAFMMWGLIGTVLLFTVWGFVRIALIGLALYN